MSNRSGEVWRGVSKSNFSSAAGYFPSDVGGKTIYITSIHNAQASDSATISIANAAGNAAETTLAIVKAGTSFTPETPIGPVTEGRKVHTNKGSVTVTYLIKDTAAPFTGPNGYPWDQANDTFAGPFAYSY